MKKLLKVFGLITVIATLMCLSGCSGLFGGKGFSITSADDVKEYMEDSEAINHTFYLSDDKSSYIYYTSTTLFNYPDHDNCVYQMSFTPTNSAATKGSWKLYSRPIASTNTIEKIYEGNFEGVNNGSVRTGGTVNLYLEGEVIHTLTIAEKTLVTATGATVTKNAFTANVAASHKYLDANDAK